MKKFFIILLILIILSVAILLLRVKGLISLYKMVGSSMSTELQENDVMLTNNITNFKRADIIVFTPEGKFPVLIKRIIGLPGETVKIKDGNVSICDTVTNVCEVLEEPYLPENVKTNTRCGVTEFKIQEGFFVLGDNRGFSTDSLCCFGLECYEDSNYEVVDEDIIGKVFLRLFPRVKFY